ncbi:MAG TPA: rhomboid family intramembrane serine protease [Anaerohalosphaeraceae bacterium]|nr:rhomboid family intramembrane serine protease [Anaerohalosphaeraceae bacterium]HOL88567.1 rhomboid family intramembrane serine protease [Anaerohalosphaeraceae bacterium]HPP56379.1 rhomboid family intramembrane serine protease [Anaerohalosphaeraceae bacterium]
MLLPIGTSVRPRQTPYANYLLIGLNIFFYLLSMHLVMDPRSGARYFDLRPWAYNFMLWPERPQIWQFVTYSFLHAGGQMYILHLFGNMYFLYLFGNSVNEKLGNVAYVCLYLGGAVFAGLGHALLHTNPVLGASGAVAAVTGAYLVLFPNTLITVLYWMFFIGTAEFRALYFIVFKMIVWDNIIEPKLSASAVAYDAHLAGYLFGIAAVMGLLALRLADGDHQDLWSMLRQWNRRRRFRDLAAAGYDAFGPSGPVRTVPTVAGEQTQLGEESRNPFIQQLREEIAELLRRHDAADAAEVYLKLLDADPTQVLGRQNQLDVANQLMASGRWAPAASAYEKYLKHYGGFEHSEQVHLMLGLLYGRYLSEPRLAVSHLRAALEHLTDPNQVKLCQDELARLGVL